jgi:hypothetical protein
MHRNRAAALLLCCASGWRLYLSPGVRRWSSLRGPCIGAVTSEGIGLRLPSRQKSVMPERPFGVALRSRSMSALGQNRTSNVVSVTSALGRKADMPLSVEDVC